jgi:hypothetical protein
MGRLWTVFALSLWLLPCILSFLIRFTSRSHLWSGKQRIADAAADYDEEDLLTYRRIASNYLSSKYDEYFNKLPASSISSADGREAMKALLKSVLPPLTNSELSRELEVASEALQSSPQSNGKDQFVRTMLSNRYWEEAGPRVVKELIYLDCLHSFHHRKLRHLRDDDYDVLKDSLAWEGRVT